MRHIGFSVEKEKGDYSFRNPRIDGDLGRKVGKILIGTAIARRQKNGGGLNEKSAQLFCAQHVTISLSFLIRYDNDG